jgi:ketosteroid isomerase-like protein
MAPDIEWNGLDDAMFGTTHFGARAVNQFFADWLEAWEAAEVEWEIEELTPDLLLVRSRMRTRGRVSGLEAESEIGQIWEFRDGRAVRQTMYRTVEEARQAAEQLVRTDAG